MHLAFVVVLLTHLLYTCDMETTLQIEHTLVTWFMVKRRIFVCRKEDEEVLAKA